MNSSPFRTVPTSRIGGSLLALAGLVCLQVLYYPGLATFVHALLGGHESPGSSMGYFRDRYVVAGAVLLMIGASIAVVLAARRGRRLLYWTFATIALIDLIGLVGSAEWYFRTIRAASEFRG